ATVDRHLRNGWVSAQATLDEVAHRMVRNFFLGDLAFAQQQLDMAVIARALEHLTVPNVIHAAIADMRPVRGAVLDEAYRRRSTRARIDALRISESGDLIVGAAQRHVEETERIEDRRGRLME